MPKHGNAEAKDLGIALGSAGFVNARRAAGEDDAARGQLADPLGRDVVAHDLAIDVLLADSSGDELGVLRTKVEDQDFLVGDQAGSFRPLGGPSGTSGRRFCSGGTLHKNRYPAGPYPACATSSASKQNDPSTVTGVEANDYKP